METLALLEMDSIETVVDGLTYECGKAGENGKITVFGGDVWFLIRYINTLKDDARVSSEKETEALIQYENDATDLRARITELESLLAEAREVVKPFAKESAQWNGPGSDRNLALAVSESKFGAVDAMFSLSDLRRAAALSTKLEQAETK